MLSDITEEIKMTTPVSQNDKVTSSAKRNEPNTPDDLYVEASEGPFVECQQEEEDSKEDALTSEIALQTHLVDTVEEPVEEPEGSGDCFAVNVEPLSHEATPEMHKQNADEFFAAKPHVRQLSTTPEDMDYLSDTSVEYDEYEDAVPGPTISGLTPAESERCLLAEEGDDSLGNLVAPVPTSRRRNNRLSTISVASSITAMMPLIWGSKTEASSPPSQLGWNDETPNYQYEPQSQTTSSAKMGPKLNSRRASRQADRFTNSLKDLLGLSASTSKRASRNLGVAAQTVADWKTTLDSSFDYCLGNTSRFQLDVPVYNNASKAKDSTAKSRDSKASHLKTWQRKSRMFFSNFGTSSHKPAESFFANENSSVSALTQYNTVPAHVSRESLLWDAPSLSMNSVSATPDESIATNNSRNWHSVSRETIEQEGKPSKRSRMRNFLRSLAIR